MALNKAGLKSAIKSVLLAQRNITSDPVSAADQMAEGLANAIDAYVKTGEVKAGIPVATTGSSTAQTGATTANGSII